MGEGEVEDREKIGRGGDGGGLAKKRDELGGDKRG